MKKQVKLRFQDVHSCRFDLIEHTIKEIVGREYDNPLVHFKQYNEGLDLFFDMYRNDTLVALISVFRYDEYQTYLIDYKEVENLTDTIKYGN